HHLTQDLDATHSLAKVLEAVSLEEFAEADSRLATHADIEAAWHDKWDLIRFGDGEGLLDVALRAASDEPLSPPPDWSTDAVRFLGLVRQMGRQGNWKPPAEGPTIYIPVKEWGRVLGVNRHTLGIYRKMACKAGFLRPASSASYAEHRADEYLVVM